MMNRAELKAALTTAQSLWQRYHQWSDARYECDRERRRSLLAELNGKRSAPSTVDNVLESDTPTTAGASPFRVLPISKLLEALNTNIDDHPHIVLFGNSGSGKTTLAQLIAATRPGTVVILDPKRPKGWEGPKWGSLPYVTRNTDGGYAPMVAALRSVVKEMDRRYAVMERTGEPFQQLTLIFDEARNAIAECAELADLYKKIISIGREVSVRLIVLSTNDRVKSLGLDGEGDMRDSLRRIHLGQFARAVFPDVVRLGRENHLHAVVELERWTPFDNSRTLEHVQRLSLTPKKAWDGVRYNCQTFELDDDGSDDFLTKLLQPDTAHTGMADMRRLKTAEIRLPDHPSMAGMRDIEAINGDIHSILPLVSDMGRDQKIVLLAALSVSANAIASTVGGDRNVVLARVRELRGSQD